MRSVFVTGMFRGDTTYETSRRLGAVDSQKREIKWFPASWYFVKHFDPKSARSCHRRVSPVAFGKKEKTSYLFSVTRCLFVTFYRLLSKQVHVPNFRYFQFPPSSHCFSYNFVLANSDSQNALRRCSHVTKCCSFIIDVSITIITLFPNKRAYDPLQQIKKRNCFTKKT